MSGEERLVNPEALARQEDVYESSVRPRRLGDYIGQPQVHEQMNMFIRAAVERGDALDHTLISGPPGLGKTTLAHIIAHEMGHNIRPTSGPVLEKAADLAGILTNLEHGDVLFIDEIHRLRPQIEEILYPAMEDGVLDIVIGEGPAARSMKLYLKPFTLVGATTRAGALTSPLRDRFGILQRLEFYDVDALVNIVMRSAGILNIAVDGGGAGEIARRARGTPRIANRLLRRIRDYAQVEGNDTITRETANAGLDILKVDKYGLDHMDRRLLEVLIDTFQGGPAGLNALAASVGEERDTLEDVQEPYLIQRGYLVRTARGRVATRASYEILGLRPPAGLSDNLPLDLEE